MNPPTTLSPAHLHILQHSLGCDEYGQTDYRGGDENDGCMGFHRNRYVSDETPDLAALVAAGLMVDYGAYELAGGMHYYRVTRSGVDAMRAHSPEPPKVSRGRQRYLDWLREDWSMSFGEWLKWRHEHPTPRLRQHLAP